MPATCSEYLKYHVQEKACEDYDLFEPCEPECRCRESFKVLHEGVCILDANCYARYCPPNEYFSDNSDLDLSCNYYTMKDGALSWKNNVCKNSAGCRCKFGSYRNETGSCINGELLQKDFQNKEISCDKCQDIFLRNSVVSLGMPDLPFWADITITNFRFILGLNWLALLHRIYIRYTDYFFLEKRMK